MVPENGVFVETKLRLLMAKVISVVATVITAADTVGTVGRVWLKLPRSTFHAPTKHSP